MTNHKCMQFCVVGCFFRGVLGRGSSCGSDLVCEWHPPGTGWCDRQAAVRAREAAIAAAVAVRPHLLAARFQGPVPAQGQLQEDPDHGSLHLRHVNAAGQSSHTSHPPAANGGAWEPSNPGHLDLGFNSRFQWHFPCLCTTSGNSFSPPGKSSRFFSLHCRASLFYPISPALLPLSALHSNF